MTALCFDMILALFCIISLYPSNTTRRMTLESFGLHRAKEGVAFAEQIRSRMMEYISTAAAHCAALYRNSLPRD